eukprot:scaffold19617_cov127-Isochrysis_galbana.AAC.5
MPTPTHAQPRRTPSRPRRHPSEWSNRREVLAFWCKACPPNSRLLRSLAALLTAPRPRNLDGNASPLHPPALLDESAVRDQKGQNDSLIAASPCGRPPLQRCV